MNCVECSIGGKDNIKLYTVQTLIIGSGAAALNCAEHLYDLGMRDVAIATDQLGAGTSNNSGSDKQTYYKIGIFGDVPDSPMEFASSLAAGGMMHGDIAYIEGLGSAQEFFHLVKNGVPFPHNEYGAYVGYKTDHDPRQRATSAGPKTSMFMVKKSLDQVRRAQIPILDRHEIIALLTVGEGEAKRVIGAVAIHKDTLYKDNYGLVIVNAENVVMATGGPGDMYKISVYPHGQIGNHGIALRAGAVANNLTESQFGLASTKFRWNLSGTYQQVVPAYFSADSDCGHKRYFLNDYFHTTRQKATNVFLKGYQWPFHAERLQSMGSSIVDIAVHNEIAPGRRVFMDFEQNPVPGEGMSDFSIDDMEPEAVRYLRNSGALQATPYERLAHMNPESIELYAEHGIDLREPLEVAVCAQHNNGGLRGDKWWESNIRHLFVIGELNGAHGVRPGGSALNSGQVGGARAALRIANVYNGHPASREEFVKAVDAQVKAEVERIERLLNSGPDAPAAADVRDEIQVRMSEAGAFTRSESSAREALDRAKQLQANLAKSGQLLRTRKGLLQAIQNDNLCLTHIAFLETIKYYVENGGGSRGAYMVLDDNGDCTVDTKRGSEMPHRSENMEKRSEILEAELSDRGEFEVRAVPVRPLPDDDSWYETAWRQWVAGEVFRM